LPILLYCLSICLEALLTRSTEALQACWQVVSGVAGAWRMCDLNQQQETYPGGCIEGEGKAECRRMLKVFVVYNLFSAMHLLHR
jgi:hypothetical protein